MTMAQRIKVHAEIEAANRRRIAAWIGKLTRVWMFGDYDGKEDDGDYIIGYLYKGQYIDIKQGGFYEHSARLYVVNGFCYGTLKEAKAACI